MKKIFLLILYFYYRFEKIDREVSENKLMPDAHLKVRMSSVLYVHTKRFIAEIQEVFQEFLKLQVVSKIFLCFCLEEIQ